MLLLRVLWGYDAILKASEFDSPADLARYLKKLTEDEEAYEAYFKWRDDPEEEKRFDEVMEFILYGY